jgi:hypothetical protein
MNVFYMKDDFKMIKLQTYVNYNIPSTSTINLIKIKRNIFPWNMIKTQIKRTEKCMIRFLLNQF